MNQPLKVLVLTTSFPVKGITDAGHFVESECRLLTAKGVSVKVVAPDHPEMKSRDSQNSYGTVRFRYFFPKTEQRVAYGDGIPTNLKRSFLAKLQFPLFMLMFLFAAGKHSRKADLIHCHWFPAGLIGAILKTLSGKKMVLTMHHGHSPSFLFRWILKKTDYLFSNSTFTARQTNAIFQVPGQEVLHLGIDTEKFRPVSADRTDREFRILFVGRLIALKGVKFLLEATARLIRSGNHSNVRLTVIGDGPERPVLEELSKTLGIGDEVKFTGSLPREILLTYLQQSDVFVIPTIISDQGETEGLGMTAIEAAACELPVIGSRSGGIVDVVEDGYNGFLTEPGNAADIASRLQELYQDEDLRRKMGKNGRIRMLEKFSPEQNAERLYQAYISLLTR